MQSNMTEQSSKCNLATVNNVAHSVRRVFYYSRPSPWILWNPKKAPNKLLLPGIWQDITGLRSVKPLAGQEQQWRSSKNSAATLLASVGKNMLLSFRAQPNKYDTNQLKENKEGRMRFGNDFGSKTFPLSPKDPMLSSVPIYLTFCHSFGFTTLSSPEEMYGFDRVSCDLRLSISWETKSHSSHRNNFQFVFHVMSQA